MKKNKCIDCGKELITQNAKRCLSCHYRSTRGKGNPHWKGGFPKCIDCGKRLRNWNAKRCRDCYCKNSKGEKSHNFKGGFPKCIECGKHLNYYTTNKRRCASCHHRNTHGEKNPHWKGGHFRCIDCGKELSTRTVKRCIPCYISFSCGENSPGWKGGNAKCIDCGKELSNRHAKRCFPCNLKILFKNLNHKKNKSELYLEKLLKQILPKEYRYVGLGKIWIERYNPDFINVNGKKKVIELFGDYWHKLKGDTEEKDKNKLKTYKKYGYDCLIIWEKDLKKPKTINRILKFHERNLNQSAHI